MTISDPTSSTINSTSHIFSGADSNNEVSLITDQTINTLSSLGESFSSLFSTAQQASTHAQQLAAPETLSEADYIVDKYQDIDLDEISFKYF